MHRRRPLDITAFTQGHPCASRCPQKGSLQLTYAGPNFPFDEVQVDDDDAFHV